MKRDEENKEDDQMSHLDLSKILELDTPPSNPPEKEFEEEEETDRKYEFEEEDELVVKDYSRYNSKSDIELREALDLLKSLKPNDELVRAITLIENVLKRKNTI